MLYAQDVGGDENWRLYQTDIATKQTKGLAPFEKVRVDLVAYDWRTLDTVLFQANKRDPKHFDVYGVDLKTGKIEMDTENPGGDVQGWQADNALQVRAAQVQTPDGGTIIRMRNDAMSPWRELIKWGPDETFGGASSFSPDNTKIWISSSLDVKAARLAEYDIATGAHQVIAEDSQFDVESGLTNPKTNALEVMTFFKQQTEYDFVGPKLKADYEALQKINHGDIAGLSRTLAG